jgi:hypothetical protein
LLSNTRAQHCRIEKSIWAINLPKDALVSIKIYHQLILNLVWREICHVVEVQLDPHIILGEVGYPPGKVNLLHFEPFGVQIPLFVRGNVDVEDVLVFEWYVIVGGEVI